MCRFFLFLFVFLSKKRDTKQEFGLFFYHLAHAITQTNPIIMSLDATSSLARWCQQSRYQNRLDQINKRDASDEMSPCFPFHTRTLKTGQDSRNKAPHPPNLILLAATRHSVTRAQATLFFFFFFCLNFHAGEAGLRHVLWDGATTSRPQRPNHTVSRTGLNYMPDTA